MQQYFFSFPLSFLFFLNSLHANAIYPYADSGPDTDPEKFRVE